MEVWGRDRADPVIPALEGSAWTLTSRWGDRCGSRQAYDC